MNVFLARLAEESREGELRVEQAEVEPEEPIETGRLHLFEGHFPCGHAGVLQLGGDLPQLGTLVAEGFEAVQKFAGEGGDNPLEGALALLGVFLALGLRRVRVDIGLELGV